MTKTVVFLIWYLTVQGWISTSQIVHIQVWGCMIYELAKFASKNQDLEMPESRPEPRATIITKLFYEDSKLWPTIIFSKILVTFTSIEQLQQFIQTWVVFTSILRKSEGFQRFSIHQNTFFPFYSFSFWVLFWLRKVKITFEVKKKKRTQSKNQLGTCLSDMTAAASETPATELKLGS